VAWREDGNPLVFECETELSFHILDREQGLDGLNSCISFVSFLTVYAVLFSFHLPGYHFGVMS
jgi:hypothetical protein